MFALLTAMSTCLFQDKSLDTLTPKSLTQCIKLVVECLADGNLELIYLAMCNPHHFAFSGVKMHLPITNPLTN